MLVTSRRGYAGIFIGILTLAGLGFGLWGMTRVQHSAKGNAEQTFTVDVSYEKFRKIMVRKQATAAIVEHNAMELIHEDLDSVGIDLSQDEHPILNALTGNSQADLSASKEIQVQVNDPYLDADRLTLNQQAQVGPTSMHVRTTATPTDNLKEYVTRLSGVPTEEGTEVRVSVDMRYEAKVPKFFRQSMDKRVQDAAEAAVNDQVDAIKQFISEHASAPVVLPDF